MKQPVSLLLLLFFAKIAFAQKPHAIWEDQINGGYRYVQLDAATGIKTVISGLPPISGFVAGDISATNPDSNYYYFEAQVGVNKVLFTLNQTTGTLIRSVVMTNTVVGVEYNCADSTLYGIQVNGNAYNFVKLNPVTGALTILAPILNMQGYVAGSFSLNLINQVYTYKVLTSSIFKLRSIDIKTGTVLYDNAFPDNVAGHKYSPTDNAVYGMWDNGGTYQLEKINYTTGAHTMVATYTVITPGFVSESQSMNQNGEYTFRGFDTGNNYTLFTLDVTNGAILHNSLTSDNAIGFEEPVCITGATFVKNNFEISASVYPNPAVNNFTIELNTRENNYLEIFDVLGNLVFTQTLKTEKEVISIENLNPGVYVLSLSGGGQKINRQLVISR